MRHDPKYTTSSVDVRSSGKSRKSEIPDFRIFGYRGGIRFGNPGSTRQAMAIFGGLEIYINICKDPTLRETPTFRNPIIPELPGVRKNRATADKKRKDLGKLGRYNGIFQEPNF